MRVVSVFILVAMATLGCQSDEKPKMVLTQAQLAALLVDVYVAEVRTEMIPKLPDSTIRYFIPFEEQLLKSRGITDSVLKVTYSYYTSHPKELEQIYDSVIDTLVLREQKANQSPPYRPREKIKDTPH
jgi:hypothetical protein